MAKGGKRKGRTRGGRVAIAQQGAEHAAKANTKWHHMMQKKHPAEYAEAMRRLEAMEKK